MTYLTWEEMGVPLANQLTLPYTYEEMRQYIGKGHKIKQRADSSVGIHTKSGEINELLKIQ